MTPLTPRASQIVDVAGEILEEAGPAALTMRALADRLGIRAPSLYKHFPDKAAVECALIERGLADLGQLLYAVLSDGGAGSGSADGIRALLGAYRRYALDHPNQYRLGTAGPLPRERLAPGLEEWAGTPFFLVTKEPYRAQALWSFAHGMVILELDERFPGGSELDRTWAEGAAAFAAPTG